MKDGLFNNGVFQILEDGRGNFWMSSNRGIHRANRNELNEFAEGRRRTFTSVSYGRSDGMLNIECNGGCWPSGIKARDGKLWFPTQDGAAVIHPKAVVSNPTPPPVVIESFLLDREPIPLDAPLRIPARKSNIEIEYTALSFINSDRLQFKYRLTEIDKDWVEAGTRRTAYYSHLPPGRYTFVVLAANSDGLWNEVARRCLTVLPAFYQTAWFRGWQSRWVRRNAGLFRRRIARSRRNGPPASILAAVIESQDAERNGSPPNSTTASARNFSSSRIAPSSDCPERALDGQATDHLGKSPAHLRGSQEVRDIAYNLRPYQLDQFGSPKGLRRSSGSSALPARNPFRSRGGPHRRNFLPLTRATVSHRAGGDQQHCQTFRHHRGQRGPPTRTRAAAGIQDNGAAFPENSRRRESPATVWKSGFGFPGMAERVRILGGPARSPRSVKARNSNSPFRFQPMAKKIQCCWPTIIPLFATACARRSRRGRLQLVGEAGR
jgi:hypothetical protein